MKHARPLSLAWPFLLLSLSACSGCSKEEKRGGGDTPPPPPPSASSAKAGACASGGGELTDADLRGLLTEERRGLLRRPAGRGEDVRREGQALDGRGLHDRVRRRVRGLQALRPQARRVASLCRRQRQGRHRRGEPLAVRRRGGRVRHVHAARRRRRPGRAVDAQAVRGGRSRGDRQRVARTCGVGNTSSSSSTSTSRSRPPSSRSRATRSSGPSARRSVPSCRAR